MQCIREIFPVRETESDLAVRLRIELLTDIVVEVGPERFLSAVKDAIKLSDSRYHCTIRRIRQCAGLREMKYVDPAYKAWQFVTDVVQKHIRRGPEGNYRFEPHVRLEGDKAISEPIPVISDAIQKAVRAMGGWQALANTPPEFWAQRMKDFVAMYEE